MTKKKTKDACTQTIDIKKVNKPLNNKVIKKKQKAKKTRALRIKNMVKEFGKEWIEDQKKIRNNKDKVNRLIKK